MSELQKLKSAAESVAQNPVVWAYIEALEAEIKRLKKALKLIASCERRVEGDIVDIARTTLSISNSPKDDIHA